MSMSTLERRTVKDHAILTGAAGAGLTIGEFCAEFAARASKYEAWQRFAVKALVKIGLAFGCFALARQINNERTKKAIEIAAYADLGMIIPDFIYAAVPGGLWGLVQSMTPGSRSRTSMANRFSSTRQMASVRPMLTGSSQVNRASIRLVPKSGFGAFSGKAGTAF